MERIGQNWGVSGSEGKESARNAEDPGSIPGEVGSPGGGDGNPLQYSCPNIHLLPAKRAQTGFP